MHRYWAARAFWDRLLSIGFALMVTVYGCWISSCQRAPLVELSIMSDLIQTLQVRKPALEGQSFCFHLISTTLPASSNARILFDLDTNLRASVELLEACVEAGIERFVFLSSGGTVYGVTGQERIVETTALQPICAYGVSKVSVELYLRLFQHLKGLDYKVARLSNPYGAGQRLTAGQGVVSVFMDKIAKGVPIEIWGDGSVQRDFIYIEDVVDAIMLIAKDQSEARVYNVGSGEATSLMSLISNIEHVTGKKAQLIFKAARSFDVPVNVLDCSEIRKRIGWTASTSLTEGLSLTWEHYCSSS